MSVPPPERSGADRRATRAELDPAALADALKAEALRLGMDAVGITDAQPTEHGPFYRGWLAAGRHGEMSYLEREDAVRRREDLTLTLRGARSVVVVAHHYDPAEPPDAAPAPENGIIARYARGRDYHKVLTGKLHALRRWLEERVGDDVGVRVYVDTGPVLERDLGRRAGLGWFGRNTMLIHPRRGSWFFLGSLVLDLHLPPDAPFEEDRCGTCHACLDACPTGALLGRDETGAPVMDARRCISYLTIEQRGPIPEELRPLMGNRIYGCDICQEVCPWNERFAAESREPGYAARGPGEPPAGVEPEGGVGGVGTAEAGGAGPADRSAPRHPGTEAPSLVALMRMTRADWDAFSRGSAIRRAGYAGFRRNVAVALGNWLASVAEPPQGAVDVLKEALEDEDPLVREHAAWALGRIE